MDMVTVQHALLSRFFPKHFIVFEARKVSELSDILASQVNLETWLTYCVIGSAIVPTLIASA